MNLYQANQLYSASTQVKIHQHLPESNLELKLFSINLKHFEQQLGEYKNDDYWLPKLRTLKSYRFRMCSTPLGFDTTTNEYANRFKELSTSLNNCAQIYPQHAEAVNNLLVQASALTERHDYPVLNTLLALQPPNKSGLLIKETRYMDELEGLLSKISELQHLSVVSALQLRKELLFGHLFIIGPMRWFPDYIYTAPRAQNIHIIRYDFLGDGWQPRASFFSQKKLPQRISIIQPNDEVATEVIEADEIIPTIDWNAVADHMSRLMSNNQHVDQQEFVDARLYILENNKAVFLEVDSSELVIDVSSDDVVRRVKAGNLEPGSFLVVRERGSGNYIVPLANRLLGEYATPAREAQKQWKGALRKAVVIKGMNRVLNDLNRMQAKSASAQNIRNWMSGSERKIRPRYIEDFQAIMRYLDLVDKSDDYWKKAKRINKAHHLAGIQMKKLLVAEIKKSNLGRLEQRGYQSFTPADYGTRIHAYRIVEIKPKTIRIPLSESGELLEL